MKKSLLTILVAIACMSAVAQVASPSWTIVQNSNFPFPSFGIKYLDAVNDSVIWATGYEGTPGNTSRNYVYYVHSVDGGNTFNFGWVFTSTTTPSVGDTNTYAISNIEGIDANTAWVAAYKKAGGNMGDIFKTIDGGATWLKKTVPTMYTSSSSFANIAAFWTAQTGITMGDPVSGEFEIWRTTDGGDNWTKIPGANIPNPTTGEFGIVNVFDKYGSQKLWFGTNKGRVYYTTDAGQNWNVTTLDPNNTVSDVAFTDANNGLAMTFVGTTSNAAVYATNDGGVTWTLTPSGNDPSYGRNDVCGIPGTNIFASCGAGTGNYLLSYSSDLGQTWNDWGSSGIQYLAIDFVNPDHGWAGTFSDGTTASLEGFYKYNGPLLSNNAFAGFTPMTTTICVPSTGTVNNFSTGSPAPTFTWTTIPPVPISNANASNPVFSFATAGTYSIFLAASSGTSTSNSTKVLMVYNSCTGLTDNNSVLADLSIYPNPAKNIVNIEVANADEYTIQVADMLGRTVLTEKASGEKHAIDLSGNRSGVYLMTIESKGLKTTKKIILE
jgi:hypothetical protein